VNRHRQKRAARDVDVVKTPSHLAGGMASKLAT